VLVTVAHVPAEEPRVTGSPRAVDVELVLPPVEIELPVTIGAAVSATEDAQEVLSVSLPMEGLAAMECSDSEVVPPPQLLRSSLPLR
jgi:hypothetical protein